MIVKSNAKFIWEVEGDYTLSRAQARRIFLGRAKTFQCECWKRLKRVDRSECDSTVKDVIHNKDGTINIGCATITKAHIAKAKRWLRRKA